MKIFALESTDLTHLGGCMGSEYTTTNYVKYFKSIKKAKKFAEKEYDKYSDDKIKWHIDDEDQDITTSGDLSFVEYQISEIKTED